MKLGYATNPALVLEVFPKARRADRCIAGAVRPRMPVLSLHQARLTPPALAPVRRPAPAKLFGGSTTVLAVTRPTAVRSEDMGGQPVASPER